MKRSEMLNKIKEIISEVTYENIAKKKAIKILDTIEEMGMVPPVIEDNVKVQELEDGNMFIEIWKWESEDE